MLTNYFVFIQREYFPFSIYLSLCLCLYIYISICPFLCLLSVSFYSYLNLYLSISISICMSIYISISLSLNLSISPFYIYLNLYLSISISIFPFLCLSLLSVSLCVYSSSPIYLSLPLSTIYNIHDRETILYCFCYHFIIGYVTYDIIFIILFYMQILGIFTYNFIVIITHHNTLTKITVEENEVVLRYYKVRELNFLAVIVEAIILLRSVYCCQYHSCLESNLSYLCLFKIVFLGFLHVIALIYALNLIMVYSIPTMILRQATALST